MLLEFVFLCWPLLFSIFLTVDRKVAFKCHFTEPQCFILSYSLRQLPMSLIIIGMIYLFCLC